MRPREVSQRYKIRKAMARSYLSIPNVDNTCILFCLNLTVSERGKFSARDGILGLGADGKERELAPIPWRG